MNKNFKTKTKDLISKENRKIYTKFNFKIRLQNGYS